MAVEKNSCARLAFGRGKKNRRALGVGARPAENLPCLRGVGGDQARGHWRNPFDQRRFANEGAEQFAAFRFHRQPQLGEMIRITFAHADDSIMTM
ncbi:MAG: hypothetical protein FD148_3596 [Methylocystaceae bacterium]|nr:MAG: hypothetical protein FD148_3596 [Methylocystaceae bacterium]